MRELGLPVAASGLVSALWRSRPLGAGQIKTQKNQAVRRIRRQEGLWQTRSRQSTWFMHTRGRKAAPDFCVSGFEFEHEAGTFVAILGRNGCGKSTLAKHCNAIALPAGGAVMVFGMDTRDESNLIPIRRTVGMVFQNPDNQIVANVVEEDVAFARKTWVSPPRRSGGGGRGPAPGGHV